MQIEKIILVHYFNLLNMKRLYTLSLFVVLILSGGFSLTAQQCPVTIQMLDISGATGFPETNELQIMLEKL